MSHNHFYHLGQGGTVVIVMGLHCKKISMHAAMMCVTVATSRKSSHAMGLGFGLEGRVGKVSAEAVSTHPG